MSALVYDPRLYDLMRQSAITTIEEALVEIVTNSHDAYLSASKIPGGENSTFSSIFITADKIARLVTVKDDAKGMNAQDFRDRILTVGSLTADEFTRGLIGRGAKDVSNIGNVEFHAIKDNKYSLCKINMDLTGEVVVEDRDVTQEDRDLFDIKGNGMMVKIFISTMVDFPDNAELFRRLKNNYFLRKLYTESTHPIVFNGQRLTYSYPPGEEVISLEFNVPEYDDAKAQFKLYRSKELIPNPPTDLEMRYGVLVTSSYAVYECGGLFAHNNIFSSDYRWNPNMKFVYGELKCDYIDKLAREISTVGKTIENPFLIFDPNRRNGLHKKHPFTIALYEIPYRWLEILLNKLQDERDEYLVTSDDIQQMLSSVEGMLEEKLPMVQTVYTWRSKSDHDNLKAMAGKITSLKVNQDVVNIDNAIIDQIVNGTDILPIKSVEREGRFKFDIKISESKDMTKPYEVFFYSDKISVRINARDESIEPFVTFQEDKSKVDIEGEGALVAVNRILHDAVIYMMTRQTLMSTSTPTISDTNHYNEILEIQNNAKQSIKEYAYAMYKSIYDKSHTSTQ